MTQLNSVTVKERIWGRSYIEKEKTTASKKVYTKSGLASPL
ncbi:hypothetical protein MC7420_1593 [Coleofasciculus chthonoplastes PCC 7420]|uniref:Uncharacterized protein n=1 Tax=Coleofasciculus chthonoplastes PCC 7420 TaxID=118168 RepID=B4W377_9CYAN|nr:hypothetical protein MC7420_1593 [Coleofasciculus chthonoplastes PCC 7420]